MTPLTSPLRRRCPEILDPSGRCLDITLTPDDGGSFLMQWKGLRKDPVQVSLRELMEYAEGNASATESDTPAPAPKGSVDLGLLIEWAHVVGDFGMPARLGVIALAKELSLYQSWMNSGSTVSWDHWKKQHTEETHG